MYASVGSLVAPPAASASSSSESESESESSEPDIEETSSPPAAIIASNSSSVSGALPCLRRRRLYRPRSDLSASRCSRADANPWSRHASMRPTLGPRAAPATSSTGGSSVIEGLDSDPVASSSPASDGRSGTGAPRRLSTREGAGALHIVLIATSADARSVRRVASAR